VPKSSRAKSSQTKNQLKSTKSFTKKTPEPMRESSVWNIFYLGIFFIPLLINPWGTMPFEIAKSGWLLLFIGVFMFGSAIAIFTQKNVLQINKKVLLVIGLWIISFAASTIFSIAPIQSWWGSYERIQGTMTAVFYLFHFQICLQIFQDKQLQQKFFNIALGIGALISTHAIAQKLHMDPLLLGNIDEASGRSYSTLGQPNFLGQWLIFPFFIAFHKLFQTHQRNKDKIFAAISVGLSAIALFCAMNRATIIALVIAIFIFWLIQSTKRVHKVGIGLLLVAAVGANVLIFNQDLRSFNSRAVLWQSSLNLVSRTPIFGFGPETFYQTTQTVLDPKVYLTETLYNIPDRVHNEPLQTLLDQGWFGFGLYILVWGLYIVFCCFWTY
jgi:O-antigen ligase